MPEDGRTPEDATPGTAGATDPGDASSSPPVPPGVDPEDTAVGTSVKTEDVADEEDRFGRPGKAFNRNGPFYLGFVGALGAVIAIHLLGLLAQLSQVLTLIGIAAFLAIGLDPLVAFFQRRGMKRVWAVTLVFVGLLAIVGGFLAAVIPAVATQGTQLANSLPGQLEDLRRSDFVSRLDQDYGIINSATNEVNKRLHDSGSLMQLFGGLVGAGRAVVSGLFSTFTVLVLTLYFLASLHSIAAAGYRLVPATRRERVRLLGDEILRRIGGYVAGQVAVAAINGVLTFVVITILGLPYSSLLAITVGLLGLIPLVGATLGAVIVAIVALFQGWQIALIVVVYYVVYQQVENYVIAPRIMSRTVSVPGGVALVAALAGGALLGVLGALIAIPVAAAILLLIQEVWIPRQERS